MKKIEQPSIKIYARLYDEKLLKEIERLVEDEKFEDKGKVVAKCIELALPALASGKTSGALEGNSQKEYNAEKAIKQLGAIVKEMSVLMTMQMNLVTSLFRERELTLSGKRTTAGDLAEGKYEVLSHYYQDRLSELMKLV